MQDSSSSERRTTPPENVARPWPRYWARMLDILIWVCALEVAVGALFPSATMPGGIFSNEIGERLLGWMVIPFAMVLDGLVYAAAGNTPGKWIAGIRVLDLAGRRIPFVSYLARNFGVYWSGLGTGFPLISLFTLISSHSRASEGKQMSWDSSRETRCFEISSAVWRVWLVAVIYIGMTAGLVLLGLSAKTES